MSKTICNHPLVEACEDGEAGGSDYRYIVVLKPGYVFDGYMSRAKGFHTVKDFLSQPIVEASTQ